MSPLLSADGAGSAGRGVKCMGLAPDGLLPESPPETPGLEVWGGALSWPGRLSPLGALESEGALAFPGELAPVGALALPGALPPVGALEFPGADVFWAPPLD